MAEVLGDSEGPPEAAIIVNALSDWQLLSVYTSSWLDYVLKRISVSVRTTRVPGCDAVYLDPVFTGHAMYIHSAMYTQINLKLETYPTSPFMCFIYVDWEMWATCAYLKSVIRFFGLSGVWELSSLLSTTQPDSTILSCMLARRS